ncbi:MAG: homoserine O-succinyltransferase [Acidobacteria bacterium]|nr:homoserine O-succinyltransferase [Acidobacteriota bacterium]
MPLVEHSSLPTFRDLRGEGQTVLTLEEARRQHTRAVHVGLLNMMPDAAFQVTERQFMRLVGRSTQPAQLYVHCFTVEGLTRGTSTQAYIAEHYEDIASIHAEGLDALIVTGANVANPRLDLEPFYQPLTEVIGWASEHVTSVLCSCLATHALMRYLHRINRSPLPRKQWGVYSHRVIAPQHPLVHGLNAHVDVPHSRYNTITREQFVEAGFSILIESAEAGVHAAVSDDQFRRVYFQGHPEYDANSLLKEYRREVMRHFNGERDLPPFPEHYLPDAAAASINRYLESAHTAHAVMPSFPEAKVLPFLTNTWADAARKIFDNWLGLVCQLTNPDRHIPFKNGIDPRRPLNGLTQVRHELGSLNGAKTTNEG